MLGIARLLLACALVGEFFACGAFAQSTEVAPPADGSPNAPMQIEKDPLPGLPHPPDAPASLFQAAPPTASFSGDVLPGPYFDGDPRLDPPSLPQPGWLADVDVGIDLPHVRNNLNDQVSIAGVNNNRPFTVQLPSARLDWTAAPRFDLGYRLPDGFGEFALVYRFLVSQGSGTVREPDGLASLRSRLAMNMADLDYASNELTIWCCWGMKWRLGLRGADIFFDSRADEPFAAASAGSKIFETSTANNYWGIGPHAALEMERSISDFGLSIVGKLDGAILLGRVDQTFFAASTLTGPGGHPVSTTLTRSDGMGVPMINASLGLAWRPPTYPCWRFSAGYEYEYWWNVGRFADQGPQGEVYDQGVVLRACYNY